MNLIVDADQMVYASGFVLKEGEPVAFALNIIKNKLVHIMNTFNCTKEDTYVYISGEGNFRNYLATRKEYKVSRKSKPKPLYYKEMREYLRQHWDAIMSMGEEADDLVAIHHMKIYRKDKKASVICTIDKDLNNVPGLHYNYVKDKLVDISPDKAYYNFCKQMLVGDPIDDVPGVPGIGEVKATKLLSDIKMNLPKREALEITVLQTYLQNGLTYEDFLETGRLLFIRTKPGQIWNPKVTKQMATDDLKNLEC